MIQTNNIDVTRIINELKLYIPKKTDIYIVSLYHKKNLRITGFISYT